MEILAAIASGALLLAGSGLIVVGALGMLRLPDLYTRMHAASIIDTMGLFLIMAGLMIEAGAFQAALKIGLIALLLMLASPTATHALARAALGDDILPKVEPSPMADRALEILRSKR